MKMCNKFFFCSRISFICAKWMQDVMQSNIFSCGTDTSSVASDSAEQKVHNKTNSTTLQP